MDEVLGDTKFDGSQVGITAIDGGTSCERLLIMAVIHASARDLIFRLQTLSRSSL